MYKIGEVRAVMWVTERWVVERVAHPPPAARPVAHKHFSYGVISKTVPKPYAPPAEAVP